MFKWLKQVIYIVLIILFIAVGILFSIQNAQLVKLDFVFLQGPELSVALYIIVSFSLGVLVALLMSSVVYLRSERQVKVLNRRYEKAVNELDALRKVSITKELSVGKE